MARLIYLEDRKSLLDLIKGPNSPDFSRMIIDEIAVAVETPKSDYKPGFHIYVDGTANFIEISIDTKQYREILEKNLKHLEIAGRYEDCVFAKKVIDSLDLRESERDFELLLHELNQEHLTHENKN